MKAAPGSCKLRTGKAASPRNSWEPRAGAVEHGAELFAKRVGEYLDHARNERRFERLYLVAAPKFLGQLRRELGKETGKLVIEELDKDLSWFDQRSLEGYVARQN